MNIRGLSIDEAKKAVLAFVVAVFALAAFFITFDPGAQTATIAVVVAVFNVIGVFMAKNHTADDLQKALTAFQASTVALLAFFVTVDPSTVESVGAILTAIVNVYAVYKVTNKPLPN